jgi:hypothetical protein
MLSDDYQSEIGTAGRFLVVVAAKSREHFDNLRAEVTRVGGAGYQLFVWDQGITAESVLSAPIWYLSHLEEPVSFEQYDTPDFLHYVEQTLTDPGNPVPRLKLLRGA